MLQLKEISKYYKTGEYIQKALNQVSLNFRDSEFVSILGSSGSGKTTLLNIIGGLDKYSNGDLLINGISTKEYKDKDWDAYRNHSIGFVFQSYNLIPHQSVLSNVELALTISGISRNERLKRAKTILDKVGLGDQIHKKPNQMSGGQMQRVAIARALVNNPDILLADEPTGALDSETSIQIMNLLREVAKDRLVIMVTHNPELAQEYSSRIIKLKDGKIIDDSAPFEPVCNTAPKINCKKTKKVSMSFLTSLSLSFDNLRTKKGRTALTSFAGSIGIIGIALILSLSTGVNGYISDIQKDTMTSYPITIHAEDTDMASMVGSDSRSKNTSKSNVGKDGGIYADYSMAESKTKADSAMRKNNLEEFKKYLDSSQSDIRQYIGENGIVYSYDVNFEVYSYDKDNNVINSDTEIADKMDSNNFPVIAGDKASSLTNAGTIDTAKNFEELMSGKEGNIVSPVITDNYDLLYGSWPENYNDVILVLDENNMIPLETLYQMGFITEDEYNDITNQISEGKDVDEIKWNYEDICNHKFYLVPACDRYVQNENGSFDYIENVSTEGQQLMQNGIELKISGIIRPNKDADNTNISTSIAYSNILTNYIIEHTNQSPVVLAQEKNPEMNILNGTRFSTSKNSQNTVNQTYENNMKAFGKVSHERPDSISIYADNFNDKENIERCIENYNKKASENNKITYTDFVAILISSITSIIDVISYVLIAFVGVSLFVSCIMIGIITHISVMERTKEIGILRALGASKRSISNVFNAETFIIGLCAGLLGVGLSVLLTIPINSMIQSVFDIENLSAALPISYAIILIFISIIITLIGGLYPARKASKKAPVIALHTE